MYRLYELVGERHSRVRKVPAILLTVGFLGLVGGLVAAHLAPASSYEVDIYAATPLAFWIGVGIAYLSFLLTCFSSRQAKTVVLGLLLGGASTFSITALPLIRGYHFFGHSDAMTHLGWVRAIQEGSLDTLSFIYPGSHSLSSVLHELTGLDVPFAMMLVVLCFVAIFLLFVPLSVHALTGDMRTTACAGFSAFLLLPVNNIAPELPYFPFLLATFFFAMIAYLLIKHITLPSVKPGAIPGGGRYAPTSAVLPIASLALLFFHPQVTMDVLAVFGGVVLVQLYVRWRHPSHPLAGTGLILGQFLFLLVILYLWSSNQGAAVRTANSLVDTLLRAMLGGEGAEFADTAASRANSAEEIGVSLLELFVKLFLVSAIYCTLAAVAVVAAVSDRFSFRDRTVSNVVVLFFFGGIAVGIVSLLHTFGGISSYLYRHIGFGMLLMTILGSIGLAVVIERARGVLGDRWSLTERSRRVRSHLTDVPRALGVLLAVSILVLSLLSVFPSPFIYNANGHVTEAHVDGYETALLHKPDAIWDSDEAVWYGGIRTGHNRYSEARRVTYPREKRLIFSGSIPNGSLGSLVTHYRTHNETIVRRDHYVPVLSYHYGREAIAYRGLRYPPEGFRALRDQPAVHRIQDNGDFTSYYVDIDLYNETALVR